MPPGASWGLLAASWSLLGPPGASWELPAASWGVLGASWSLLGPSGGLNQVLAALLATVLSLLEEHVKSAQFGHLWGGPQEELQNQVLSAPLAAMFSFSEEHVKTAPFRNLWGGPQESLVVSARERFLCVSLWFPLSGCAKSL